MKYLKFITITFVFSFILIFSTSLANYNEVIINEEHPEY